MCDDECVVCVDEWKGEGGMRGREAGARARRTRERVLMRCVVVEYVCVDVREK